MWFSVLSRDHLSHCWNIRPQSSIHATVLSDVWVLHVSLTPSLAWTKKLILAFTFSKGVGEGSYFYFLFFLKVENNQKHWGAFFIYQSCRKLIAYRHQSCFHFHGACVYKVLGLLCHTVIFLFRILFFFVRVFKYLAWWRTGLENSFGCGCGLDNDSDLIGSHIDTLTDCQNELGSYYV